MNPAALHAMNSEEDTPFDVAVREKNQRAIDLFKWRLPIDDTSRKLMTCSRTVDRSSLKPSATGDCMCWV